MSCRLSLKGLPCSSTVSDLVKARTLSWCAFDLNVARSCFCPPAAPPTKAALEFVGVARRDGRTCDRVARRSALDEARERCILVLQSCRLNDERAVTSQAAFTPTAQGSQQEYSSELHYFGKRRRGVPTLVRALLQKKDEAERKGDGGEMVWGSS